MTMILTLLAVFLCISVALMIPGAFIALVVYAIVKCSQQSSEASRERARKYVAGAKFAAEVHSLLRAR